jgi:phosphoribosylaminoimidazolecarboxamide formyltransferase/IMP cyclohydrolase
MTVARALISVSDKTGLLDFARGLSALGIEILSTGGTASLLSSEGIKVRQVQDFTGAPEMLGGRVKTLHPKVHGGILARRKLASDQADIEKQGLQPIDLVVVNLYPFREAVAKGLPHEQVIENIDIGGPSMIRSAAKNAEYVTVVVDPADYGVVLAELQQKREVHESTRRRLQARAYAHTSAYDAAIAGWLAEQIAKAHPEEGGGFAESPPLPEYRRLQSLRYGENPHQRAAFYRLPSAAGGLADARQLQGKELSYNNLQDAAAAFELVSEYEEPAAAIIKHTNPCGVAVGADLAEAYRKAYECDTVSAFGGVVALNRSLDAATAELAAAIFLEVVIAPGFQPEALQVMGRRANVRLLETRPERVFWQDLQVRSVPGGLLVQSPDRAQLDRASCTVATKRAPTDAEWRQLDLAWRAVKHVKSNAITLAREDTVVGVGAGQMSRVESVQIAVRRAGERAAGSVLASDAFFPYADGVQAAIEAGVTALIQPGGSVRDAESIAAADAAGVAMVMTGVRHFRH